MIKKLRVKGFQSHIDTELIFDSKVNIIRGDNGSGKSALRRALFWVLTNKPTGTSFINWTFEDSTPCEVTLEYGEHTIIRRRSRDSKINEYIVDKTRLTAFGVSVPQPVLDIINLDDTNIELQHSALFMLSESAPDMARRLNKLTNLEDIDKAFSSIRRRKLDISKQIKYVEGSIKDLDIQIDKYTFLKEATKVADRLETMHELENSLNDDYIEIGVLETDLKHTIQGIKALPPISRQEVDEKVEKLKECNRVKLDVNSLYNEIYQVKINEPSCFDLVEIEELRNNLLRYEVEVDELRVFIDNLYSLKACIHSPVSSKEISIDKLKEVMNEYFEVDRLITDINKVTSTIEQISVIYTVEKEKYNAELPEECPLCGSILRGLE